MREAICAPSNTRALLHEGLLAGSVAGVTTGADILIINTGPAIPTPVRFNLIGAWLRLHLRDIARFARLPSLPFPSLRAETSFFINSSLCKGILCAMYGQSYFFFRFIFFFFENSEKKNLTDE